MSDSAIASTTARYPSPLRYPGGKGKVVNYIKAVILENDLTQYEYVEPYAGGASVALSLLYEDYASSIHINDLNAGVHAFWLLATEDPEDLCARIQYAALTVDEWRRQRLIYHDPQASTADLGFATFYLNRTNRSGIISRGSVIGGIEQHGDWKIDARFNKSALCARIRKIARFASRIHISRLDAVELIEAQRVEATRRFYYLDPPYYVKGSRLYDNSYAHEDHVLVRNAVRRLLNPWIMSYDSAPAILEMHGEWQKLQYALSYSASQATSGAEVMFFSENLTMPSGLSSPASVSVKRLRQLMSEALF